MVIVGWLENVSGRPDAAWIEPWVSRSAMCAAPIVTGAVPYALLSTTRTFEPPMLAWTICRSVWFVDWTKGGGAKVCAGAVDTAAAGGAGHRVFAMKGRGAGAGGVGFCGRPT